MVCESVFAPGDLVLFRTDHPDQEVRQRLGGYINSFGEGPFEVVRSEHGKISIQDTEGKRVCGGGDGIGLWAQELFRLQ